MARVSRETSILTHSAENFARQTMRAERSTHWAAAAENRIAGCERNRIELVGP